MDARDALAFLVRWSWLLIVAALAGAAVGWGLGRLQDPVYEASATLLVGGLLQDAELDAAELATSEDLARAYAELAVRRSVLDAVAAELRLPAGGTELRDAVSVRKLDGGPLLEVTARAASPDLAVSVANELARGLIAMSPAGRGARTEASTPGAAPPNVASGSTATLGAPNVVTVVEAAHADPAPVRPRTGLNVLVGTAVGGLLGLLLVLLGEGLDETLRSPDDVERALGEPVLGVVRTARRSAFRPDEAAGRRAEAYRVVRDRIEGIRGRRPFATLVVTSPTDRDRRAPVAANLAAALARAGRTTVLVDADARRPEQHELFGVDPEPGLIDVLTERTGDRELPLRATGVEGLRVLTGGRTDASAADVLRPRAVERVLERLHASAEMVILSAGPVLTAAEAGLLAGRADGVVLVVTAGRTRAGDARAGLDELRWFGAEVLGVVLVGRSRRLASARWRRRSATTAGARSAGTGAMDAGAR